MAESRLRGLSSWLRSSGCSQAARRRLECRSPHDTAFLPLSLCPEELFPNISSATFRRLGVCIQSAVRQALREACVGVHVRVCVCTCVYARAPWGIGAPSHKPRGARWSQKQMWEQRPASAVRSAFACLRSALTLGCCKGQCLARI